MLAFSDWAITEMVPISFGSLTFLVAFGPQEIWIPINLGLHENHYMAFLGPKKVRGPKEIEDQFSYSLRLSMKGKFIYYDLLGKS